VSADKTPVRVLDLVAPMRDGIRLAADVLVLDDGAQHPVLLMRTPYSRASLREAYDVVSLARAGWSVVLQDVRGRLDSEGQFRPFAQEVEDGFDTIAWCAEQPWSDGRVAMAGASYNAATQWLAAASGAPALKAIAPVVIGADLRDGFCYEGGAFQQGFLSGWAVAIAASGNDPALTTEALAAIPTWPELLRADDEPLRRLLPEYGSWRDDDETWWKSVDISGRIPHLDLPAWHLAGWYDVFCEGSLAAYQAMVANSPAGARQRLVVGPWAHVGLYQQVAGEVDFGPAANGLAQGFPAQMTAFLRDALEGGEVQTGVSVFVMGEDTWRELETWPPTCSPYTLHLAGEGRLSTDAGVGTERWQHDPADPVPTCGGRTLQGGLPGPGPVDQRAVQQREDVLVHTSPELTEDVTVIGTVTARLVLTCSTEQADVRLTLCDVHPDGRVLNVVDGGLRTTGSPGSPRTVDLQVGSTAMTFRAGHRIGLALSSSSWPRFDLSPACSFELDLASSFVTLPTV